MLCVSCEEYSGYVRSRQPYLDPQSGQCVSRCPDEAPVPDASGVCHTCAELDPRAPLYWDQKCVACEEKRGGAYFHQGACTASCPETHDEHSICRTCADLSPAAPVWDSATGSCVPCEEGLYWDGECTRDCSWKFVSLSGTLCVDACGAFQTALGKRCTCAPGFERWGDECVRASTITEAQLAAACGLDGRFLDFAGDACVSQCGPSEKPVGGRCVCKNGAVPREDGAGCVARRACPRLRGDGEAELCLTAATCGDGLLLALDGARCVGSCGAGELRGRDRATGEARCVRGCSEGELERDGACLTCADIDRTRPLLRGQVCVACEEGVWDGAACVPVCPGPVEDGVCTPCVTIDPLLPHWSGAACGKCPPELPHWDGACVAACPYARPVDRDGACTACPAGLVGREGSCVSCAEANPARPVWDAAAGRCRACDARRDGGAYWGGATCLASCPETSDFRGVCVTCAALDPAKPAWRGDRCAGCEESILTPLLRNGACAPCPYGREWDAYSRTCAPVCGEGQMRVEGKCVAAAAENCPDDQVFAETRCVACAASLGLVREGDVCVCDRARHLVLHPATATCVACDSPLLAYDAASVRCYCRNGGVLAERDGALSCELRCESGIFALDEPERCLAACPSDMVLFRDGARQLCGRCAGYAYFDPRTQTTACVTYAQCLAAGMVPQVVREGGASSRVCGEAPVQTLFSADGETVEGVRGLAVVAGEETAYHVLRGGELLVSTKGFAAARDGGEMRAAGVAAIGQYLDGVFALGEDGALAILESEKAREARVEGVVQADGAADFGAYLTADGAFHCESPAGLCPERLPGPVHGVSSANRFGLTLQLQSGALYYRRGGVWVEDAEAVAAGALGDRLYRLLEDGTVLEDGRVVGTGSSLLVTDEAVLVDGAPLGSARKLGTDAATRTETRYRTPLATTREQTLLLGENGCEEGALRTGDGCVRTCAGFVSADGSTCYEVLPPHMETDGRVARCARGFVPSEDGLACVCPGVVGLDGTCAAQCGPGQRVLDGECACDAGRHWDERRAECVAEACARVRLEGDAEVCLEAPVCSGALKLAPDSARLCVADCEPWTEDAETGELRCVEACPGWWYRAEDGLCRAQAWRRTVAIAVPAALGAGILLAVLVAALARRRKDGPREGTRMQVVQSE